MEYQSTNKTEYFAKYHIIWCPKYWRRVLDVTQLDVVSQYIENQKTAA